MEWNTVLTRDELEEHWADCAKLDPSFAARSKAFYERQTAGWLKGQAHGCWLCNEREGYVLANSYLALK